MMTFHDENIAGIENGGEDSSKDDEFSLVLEEVHCGDGTYLHHEDIQTSTSSSFEDKGLVSFVPIQIFEFNDDLKWIEFVEKPLEDEDLSGALILSCDKERVAKIMNTLTLFSRLEGIDGIEIVGIFVEIPSMILIVRALGLKIQILCLLDNQRTWTHVMHCFPLINNHTSSTKRKVCCSIRRTFIMN